MEADLQAWENYRFTLGVSVAFSFFPRHSPLYPPSLSLLVFSFYSSAFRISPPLCSFIYNPFLLPFFLSPCSLRLHSSLLFFILFSLFLSILFSLSNIISKHPRKLDMDVVQLWAAKSVLQQVFQEYPDLHRNVPNHFFKVSYSYIVHRWHVKEGRAGAQYICSCCGCTRVLGKRNMGRHNYQGVLEDHWDLALTRLRRCHFFPFSY